MENKSARRAPDRPLSESTISPTLSAIQERCSDLFDTNDFIELNLVDGENDADAYAAGAYNPYGRRTASKCDKRIT